MIIINLYLDIKIKIHAGTANDFKKSWDILPLQVELRVGNNNQ